jgi:hypothetical protein
MLKVSLLRGDRAWCRIHHRDIEAGFGEGHRLKAAAATRDQDAARRQRAGVAPGKKGRIEATPLPAGSAVAIAALPINGLGLAHAVTSLNCADLWPATRRTARSNRAATQGRSKVSRAYR